MKRFVILFLAMAAIAAIVFHVLCDPASAMVSAGNPARVAAEENQEAMATSKAPTPLNGHPLALDANQPHAQTPAWLLPSPSAIAKSPNTLSASDTAGSSSNARIARLSVVLEKLDRLQGQPTIDTKEVGAAIAELEKINGSSVMSGVRLNVLRENLQVADQMQTAQKALQTLESAPAANSPERSALIQLKTAELAALRSRIRHDIMQPPASGVSP